MKSSNIGGQAVLEGIMMKHREDYAVAVRKPDGEIFVQKDTYPGIIPWKPLTTIPFVRGIFNFIDSMVLGIRTLTFSASFYEEEEEKEEAPLTHEEAARRERREKWLMRGTVAFSVVVAVAIFMVLPYLLSSLLPICLIRDRRICQDRHFCGLCDADLPDGGYPEDLHVPRGGAQVHQLY